MDLKLAFSRPTSTPFISTAPLEQHPVPREVPPSSPPEEKKSKYKRLLDRRDVVLNLQSVVRYLSGSRLAPRIHARMETFVRQSGFEGELPPTHTGIGQESRQKLLAIIAQKRKPRNPPPPPKEPRPPRIKKEVFPIDPPRKRGRPAGSKDVRPRAHNVDPVTGLLKPWGRPKKVRPIST